MVKMFSRSISKHNLRYTSYIADGDTKNETNIAQSKPYGDLPIIRYQCVNHFAKRMKTRLLNIKKKHGRTRLDDKKTIGGVRRLGINVSKQIKISYALFLIFQMIKEYIVCKYIIVKQSAKI
jgi:hypothetical protein